VWVGGRREAGSGSDGGGEHLRTTGPGGAPHLAGFNSCYIHIHTKLWGLNFVTVTVCVLTSILDFLTSRINRCVLNIQVVFLNITFSEQDLEHSKVPQQVYEFYNIHNVKINSTVRLNQDTQHGLKQQYNTSKLVCCLLLV